MATERCSIGARRIRAIPVSGSGPDERGPAAVRHRAGDTPVRLGAPLPRFLVLGGGRPSGEFGGVHFSTEPEAEFDALIVADAAGAADVPALLRRHRSWLAPVADLAGSGLWFADVRCDDGAPASWRRAVDSSMSILDALGALPEVVVHAEDDETRLLARVHSRALGLQPVYDPSTRRLVRYPAAGLLEEPERIADALVGSGWLARTFFDRMHVCPGCGSSRMNVREQCPACGSAQLGDQSIIHHFRCAHQAIERDFGQGDLLTCPKCRRRLRHFGVDYDRPGSMTVCAACGHIDDDADVAFVCLDCGRNADAASVATRDWHAYTMTPSGAQRLLGGDLRSLRPNAPDFAAVHALVEHWMRIRDRYGRPFAVLRLSFTRAAEVDAEVGPRTSAMARLQAIEIVRGEIRDTDFTVETADGLLIVMPETDSKDVEVPRRRIENRLAAALAVDLGIELWSVDANEIFSRSAAAT